MSRFWTITAVAAVVGTAFVAAAEARELIDTILLVKGDRATGEIVSLESGILTVRTLAFGTVNIEWTDVVALISIQRFDLERSDGLRFKGHFDAGETPGTLLLRQSEEELIEIPLNEVFAIRQLGASIWNSRRGHLNLGLDYTHTSEDTKLSLDANLTLQGRRFRFNNTLVSSISDDSRTEQRERTRAESQVEIPAGTRFFVLTRGSWETNDELALDSRFTVGAALIWVPWRSANGRFGVGGGLLQSEERYRGEDSSQSVTGAAILAGVNYHRFGVYGTVISAEFAYLPILSESNRFRFEMNASVSQEIGNNFDIAVSPYYSFDSKPPRESLNGEDWGWVSSIGWSF